MRNWSFCRCFQIWRKSEKKRIRKATETGFSLAGGKLSRCRRGLCSDVSEERSEGREGRRRRKRRKKGTRIGKNYKTKQANKQKREENRRRGQDMEAIVEEELQLDGAQVRATLRNTGVLQWHGATKQGSLVVQDDLIGIKGEGELCIILHTFCISSSYSSKRPICRGAAAAIPKRKRKDMRLSFANERSRQMWFETIQRFLDEAGNCSIMRHSFILSVCLSFFMCKTEL